MLRLLVSGVRMLPATLGDSIFLLSAAAQGNNNSVTFGFRIKVAGKQATFPDSFRISVEEDTILRRNGAQEGDKTNDDNNDVNRNITKLDPFS